MCVLGGGGQWIYFFAGGHFVGFICPGSDINKNNFTRAIRFFVFNILSTSRAWAGAVVICLHMNSRNLLRPTEVFCL